MIQTIRLDAVLSEAHAATARHLVTRATGRAVRSRIAATLDEGPGWCACLDFSAVGIVDFSCADEVVAKLVLAEPDAATGRRRLVVLVGLRAEHHDALAQVCDHHRIAVLDVAALSTDALAEALGWAVAEVDATRSALPDTPGLVLVLPAA